MRSLNHRHMRHSPDAAQSCPLPSLRQVSPLTYLLFARKGSNDSGRGRKLSGVLRSKQGVAQKEDGAMIWPSSG